MKNFVLNLSRTMQASDKIPVERFLLSSEKDKDPSFFEIIFIHQGVRYRYGFEVDQISVVNEWLFYAPKGKEAKLFIREGNNLELGPNFKEGKGLYGKTRKNALFLSVTAQFNGEISINILKWFKQKLRIISGLDDKKYADFTFKKIIDEKGRNEILKFLAIADLGISDIKLIPYDLDKVPEKIKEKFFESLKAQKKDANSAELKRVFRLVSFHDRYDKENIKLETIPFEFGVESEGTKKLFSLAGLVTHALIEGDTLIVDELDSRLHPMMTRFLIELFNSNETNRANAQLIFVTHDTNLLTNRIFRRDQIWFTEKDRYGATDLYSLVDYKVRADASFSKDYILGKYGAIPFLGDPRDLLGK